MKYLQALLIGSGLIFLLASCDGANPACMAGKQCNCTGPMCAQTCDDENGGCQFSCSGDVCDDECAGGGCQVTCEADDCTLDCPGGGCQLDCVGASSCHITGCQSGCQLSCGGASSCESSCSAQSACTVIP